MRRILWLSIGIALGALGMWTSMNYHILRTSGGISMVPKYRPQLISTFVDVREWGVTEWTEHPELVLALEKNNRSDILGDTKIFGTSLRDASGLLK